MLVGTPSLADGTDFRTVEFNAHYGLANINADLAYQRGYFGQDVIIAVMDDGFDLAHADLAPNMVTPYNAADPDAALSEEDADTVHGTYMALLAAGASGNAGSTFAITLNDATAGGKSTANLQGVAPQAKILPIQARNSNTPLDSLAFAIANGAKIINVAGDKFFNGGEPTAESTLEGMISKAGVIRPGIWAIRDSLPLVRPRITTDLEFAFLDIAKAIAEEDVLLVWPAGDNGWHAGNRIRLCGTGDAAGSVACGLNSNSEYGDDISQQDFLAGFEIVVRISEFSANLLSYADWSRDGYGIDLNDPGGFAIAPLFVPRLADAWLVVGAVDEDNLIADFSNGCGLAKPWCLMAPGKEIAVGPDENISGTAFSSALVSGALAVLKSRLPTMPMAVVKAVLLKSAKPLGTRTTRDDPPDDIYGWGVVDVQAAVEMQGEVQLTRPELTAVPSKPVGVTSARLLAEESFMVALPAPAVANTLNYRDAAAYPEFNANYVLGRINADAAYQRGYFGEGVTIAVIDDGFDITHPDLVPQILGMPFNAVENSINVTEDDAPHGTVVALLAAGAMGNTFAEEDLVASRDSRVTEKVYAIKTDFEHPRGPTETVNLQGVAPQAKLRLIQQRRDYPLDPIVSLRRALAGAVFDGRSGRSTIVNNSYGEVGMVQGKYEGRPGWWITTGALPQLRPLIDNLLKSNMAALAIEIERSQADIVYVWASGNFGWHENSILPVSVCGKAFASQPGCVLTDRTHPSNPPDFDYSTVPPQYNPWVTPQDLIGKFQVRKIGAEEEELVSFQSLWEADGLGVDYNGPGGYPLAPLFAPSLLGKWLTVGGIGGGMEEPTIAFDSDGCGLAKLWCIFAPGDQISLNGSTSGISFKGGTSFAAPLVSGALAVLKSRLATMPMEVVVAVLLKSARPLGSRTTRDDPPDDVYGWGLVDLEAAITLQGDVELVRGTVAADNSLSAGTGGVGLRDVRVDLPVGFAHVEHRLGEVQIAVSGVGNAYYNAPLSDFVNIRRAAPVASSTAAADSEPLVAGRLFAEADSGGHRLRYLGIRFDAGLLGNWSLQHDLCASCRHSPWQHWNRSPLANSRAALPFFARHDEAASLQMQGSGLRPFAAWSVHTTDDYDGAFAALRPPETARVPYRQIGLRFGGGDAGGPGLTYLAEFSHIREQAGVWGANWGALGPTRTRTRTGRLVLSGQMAADWRGFAAYHQSQGAVASAGYLARISGLRAWQWSAGAAGRGVLLADDRMRFSVHHSSGMRGRAVLRHAVVSGDFSEAFYRGAPQRLEQNETAIDLQSEATTELVLGYSIQPRHNIRWAFGLEYDSAGDNAVSTQFNLRF